MPFVLLDDAPRRARVSVDGIVRDIDLGAHVGLSLEGDPDATGSDDEAIIVYTSAMAGRPLGAVLTHRNLLANSRSTIEATGMRADHRVLALLPFAHLFGLTVTCGTPLLAGAHVVTMPRFTPGRALELIEKTGVTDLVGVPAVFRALLATIERRDSASIRSLRMTVCGGSPLSEQFQNRWFDATGIELRQGYGLTEAGPVCLFNRVDRPNVRGTLGVALPSVDIALRRPVEYDAHGKPLVDPRVRDDEVEDGEICVRGDNVFRRYLSNGDAGLQVRDGWLHTGDCGRRGPHGTIAFAGVVKPMFTRNGFNVYPREIEQAVLELPGISHVAVSAREDADAEPEIELDVAGTATEAEIRAWCEERLSAYKQPATIRLSAG
jgi:long-chain acyl-CoA synthetase